MELNLTKVQKIAILDRAIYLLETEREPFMCTAIEMATCFVIKGYGYSSGSFSINRFPELLKYKPMRLDECAGWFPIEETEKRINILKEIKHEIESK